MNTVAHIAWRTSMILLCMAFLLSQCAAEVSISIDTPTPTAGTSTRTDTTITPTHSTQEEKSPRPRATLIPSPTKIGSALIPLAPTKVRIDTGVVKPTETPKMLRFVRESLNEAATCVAIRIQGIDTSGWRVTIDGIKLAAEFDENSTARVCGLRAGAEFTFTIRDAKDAPVAGGAGIPARDTAIMLATWE